MIIWLLFTGFVCLFRSLSFEIVVFWQSSKKNLQWKSSASFSMRIIRIFTWIQLYLCLQWILFQWKWLLWGVLFADANHFIYFFVFQVALRVLTNYDGINQLLLLVILNICKKNKLWITIWITIWIINNDSLSMYRISPGEIFAFVKIITDS